MFELFQKFAGCGVEPHGFDLKEFPVMMRLGVTRVPVPNTTVKPKAAEGTWLVTARENRRLPERVSTDRGLWLVEVASSSQEDSMTKFELLTVLKSMELAIEKGTKEDVQKLLKDLIRAAESDKRSN